MTDKMKRKPDIYYLYDHPKIPGKFALVINEHNEVVIDSWKFLAKGSYKDMEALQKIIRASHGNPV